MAEPVTLLTDADLDRAACDARADGDLLMQELVGEARRLRNAISAGEQPPWVSCGGREVL